MKNFALTGVAGYIAPRHLQAIKDTGNQLVAAMDPHDSVGILDRYFPDVSFFTEFERFDRHLEKLRREGSPHKVDYLSICSPNNLHDAHIRLALRLGANAICEKPLVLNPWNLDALQELEQESSARIFTILQLRVHPSLIILKDKLSKEKSDHKHEVVLSYITSRGLWYNFSWKGILEKSGGIATNIGIHFFDLLMWLFGDVQTNSLHLKETNRMSGFLELENANVKWFLSTDKNDLPEEAIKKGAPTFRSITIDGEEIQFTEGFTDLHTRVYEETLKGKGFGIEEARPSIKLVQALRSMAVDETDNNLHPFILKLKSKGFMMNYFKHESAYIDENCEIGEGTKIWHFSHIQSGARIGGKCVLGQNVNVGNNVSIGNFCKIQNNVSIYEGVTLEDYVFCGPSMVFTNILDPKCKYPQAGSEYYVKTLVKEGASIGANATIVCGTTLGKDCMIGAGSVVTKDVPDYALIVGVPGKIIGWVSEAGKRLNFDKDGIAYCDTIKEKISA
jgi:UDP-N-acetyl-2-amino-2-deoxyglucuronate dehydrogenase